MADATANRTGPRVIVVGCGIGGLTLALALGRAGIDTVVLEQAPEPTPIGAGIQLSANAVRVLRGLGLGAALARYQALRIEHATWVQQFSRAAERHYHLADPAAQRRRDERLRRDQPTFPAGFPPGQVKIYGYDAEAAAAGD